MLYQLFAIYHLLNTFDNQLPSYTLMMFYVHLLNHHLNKPCATFRSSHLKFFSIEFHQIAYSNSTSYFYAKGPSKTILVFHIGYKNYIYFLK